MEAIFANPQVFILFALASAFFGFLGTLVAKLFDWVSGNRQERKDRIDTLEQRVDKATRDVGKLTGENAQLKAELKTADERITRMAALLDDVNAQNERLTTKLKQLEDEQSATSCALGEAKDRILELESERDQFRTDLDEAQAHIQDLNARLKAAGVEPPPAPAPKPSKGRAMPKKGKSK